MSFKFLSVCSGIEAASVAFSPLGWKAVAFAEIDPFCCALLKHHYPKVPNLGDLSRYLEWSHKLLAEVDILVGGTPCQAFSVAGLRASLTDDRGNLTLTFCLLYAHICKIRHAAGRPAPLFLWENVPGVLNTPDNAFGCFLAGLAGENDALRPPGGKWLDAGYVRGPIGSVAWRTLNAEYFQLAQRRERVFALGSTGPSFNPAEVLFEFNGVRRDSKPSRKAGEGTTHDVAPCLTSSGRCTERTGDTRGQDPIVAEVCAPLTTSAHADNLSEESKLIPEVAWALQERDSKGQDSNTKRGHLIPEVCPTLLGGSNATGGTRPPGSTVDNCDSLIPELIAFSGRRRGDDGRGYDRPPLVFGEDVVGALDTMKPHCIAFPEKMSGTQCASTADLSPVLQSHNTTAVAYAIQERACCENPDAGPDGIGVRSDDCAYTLEARTVPQAVAFQPRVARNGRGGDIGDVVNALQAQSGKSGKGDGATCVAVQEALAFKPRHYRLDNKDGAADEISGPLTANAEFSGDCSPHTAYSYENQWRVRRLVPSECEVLQGFTPVTKRVIFKVCADSQKQNVLVEMTCLKKPSNAGIADHEERRGNVASAKLNSWSNHPAQDALAHVNVRTRFGLEVVEIHSLGRCLFAVNNAAKSDLSLPHTVDESSALSLVGPLSILDLITIPGREGSPLSMQNFSLPLNGGWHAAMFGHGKEVSASDVSFIPKEVIMFITSNHGANSGSLDSAMKTWLCYVLNAIASFIPEEIKIRSSFELIVDIQSDYTAIPYRGKPAWECADGPRYKSLGNSWAVPCVRWIGRRIDARMRPQMPDSDHYAEVLRIFDGSNGKATAALYARLEALGPIGIVACNLMRAQKCSSRAKQYRRASSKGAAYDTKQWAMGNLCAVLDDHDSELNITWGWKHDPKQEFHDQVLYVELPTGQASFHTNVRGYGPDFIGEWDGKKDGSQSAILRFTANLLSTTTPT